MSQNNNCKNSSDLIFGGYFCNNLDKNFCCVYLDKIIKDKFKFELILSL